MPQFSQSIKYILLQLLTSALASSEMSYLKTMLLFAQPLGIIWLLLSVHLARQAWLRQWRVLWLPGLAWLVLTLFSCTPFNSWLLADLEARFPPVTISDLQPADVIICLGGGAEPSLTEPTGVNFKGSVDRVTTSLALLSQKKAPLMVITGGAYSKAGKVYSEADAAFNFLKDSLASPLNIQSLGICADTHDEAVKLAALAKEKRWQRVLLVTSACHLPRAVATFEKADLKVSAVPCDYLSSFNTVTDMDWVHPPHGSSFYDFGAWFHEIIGTWVYRWRGWI